VYRTDIRTMMRMFEQQTLELRAETAVSGVQGLCSISLLLVRGVIQHCSIQDTLQGGLTGDEAFRFIERLGSLSWDYTLLSPEPEREKHLLHDPVTSCAVVNPSLMPTVLHTLTAQELGQLPREQRLVLMLVDGKKTLDEIATLLSKRHENVRDALVHLQTRGCIAPLSMAPSRTTL